MRSVKKIQKDPTLKKVYREVKNMKCPVCGSRLEKNETDVVGVLEYRCSRPECRLVCVRLRAS